LIHEVILHSFMILYINVDVILCYLGDIGNIRNLDNNHIVIYCRYII